MVVAAHRFPMYISTPRQEILCQLSHSTLKFLNLTPNTNPNRNPAQPTNPSCNHKTSLSLFDE